MDLYFLTFVNVFGTNSGAREHTLFVLYISSMYKTYLICTYKSSLFLKVNYWHRHKKKLVECKGKKSHLDSEQLSTTHQSNLRDWGWGVFCVLFDSVTAQE